MSDDNASEETCTYHNREAIFALLLKLGVFKATIEFDGSGDSGQITEQTLEGLTEDPKSIRTDALLKRVREDWDGAKKKFVPVIEEFGGPDVSALMDAAAYDILHQTSYDWVNNDGGFGTITIIPGDKTIFVDMNVRITTTETTEITM